MKLFLASYACKSLDKIVDILTDQPSALNVAFVTTAADPYDDTMFVKLDRDKFTGMGFNVTDIDIKDKQEDELSAMLKPYDVIAVAGGNTYYLLYHAQKSGFLNIVKKHVSQGKVYVGSSAGSILLCPTIDAAKLFDPIIHGFEPVEFTGAHLIDFLIIPHFDVPRYQERLRQTIETWSNKSFHLYPLTDTQALVVDGDDMFLADTAL